MDCNVFGPQCGKPDCPTCHPPAPQVLKPGTIIVGTQHSTYVLAPFQDGLYICTGGWFDRNPTCPVRYFGVFRLELGAPLVLLGRYVQPLGPSFTQVACHACGQSYGQGFVEHRGRPTICGGCGAQLEPDRVKFVVTSPVVTIDTSDKRAES